MNLVIEMKNINKIYKMGSSEYRALSDVNLNIEKGEFVSIVGPSGAGKSTLMNIIGCLDVATSGEYILDGEDTNCNDDKLSEIRNRKIGFIFQNYNLLPKMNVLDNVELPLIYQGLSNKEMKEKALKSLERVGLISHVKHKPAELSGGQKQRVAIARALATEPELLLADEPTGALDSKTGKEVIEMLKGLNKEGNTIVLITHDNEIAHQAKRIITVKDGYIQSDELNCEYSKVI
ncbi:macrolide ABC transporter ATP-binding protein [Clostridium carboxidivorans P7]|uniref:ABC transporter related protein n=1 Tax=Clostridium carboxidivorans P7 TaxID=536227 RepID=C6PNB5_9CLOT|nr:ABC transporter ATP-binding protein [Clostridium carboxidivorans]AKN33598.1 macrolide ABC transporter ATP-binding protein [Clostridium carboxidivorans P7]EET89236.1 ABC transporter related protein [Clostridium carboxidivorans P7]EFG86813.1 putative bacteriocin export ABC transporter, lactococcin 972 group [Clostridium carboxidivorans P7]